MTDQQYGTYEFEIYFDSVEGRTPGCGDALGWENLTSPRYLTTLPILHTTASNTPAMRGGPKTMAWRRFAAPTMMGDRPMAGCPP
jgi:hypothetical protein